MKPSLIRNPPAEATALRGGTAQRCSSMTIAEADPSGMSSSTSHAFSSQNTWMPSAAARAPASAPALTLDPEPDQRTDRGAELDSLLVRQIAQVCNLDVASDLLVHCQRIDDTKWRRSGAGVPAPRWGLDP
jgi:hypothetical protein